MTVSTARARTAGRPSAKTPPGDPMPAPQRAAAGAASPRAPSPGAGARRAQVLATLRERIARQQIPPGAKLREHELALEFGVPRSQIREAFSALEQRGLIERIPNRGAIVARLDPEQLFQIYDLREVLEGLCARLATQNAAPESWQDLVELFDGPMQQYVEQGDFERFLAGYERFRRRTIEAAAHPLLAQMLDSIYEKTQVLIRRTIILPGRAKVGLSEHRAVLAAMRRGDADAAERLRRENMRSARECLRRYQSYIL